MNKYEFEQKKEDTFVL